MPSATPNRRHQVRATKPLKFRSQWPNRWSHGRENTPLLAQYRSGGPISALCRHRRRHVRCAGMGMPVLKMTPIPAQRTCRRRCRYRTDTRWSHEKRKAPLLAPSRRARTCERSQFERAGPFFFGAGRRRTPRGAESDREGGSGEDPASHDFRCLQSGTSPRAIAVGMPRSH